MKLGDGEQQKVCDFCIIWHEGDKQLIYFNQFAFAGCLVNYGKHMHMTHRIKQKLKERKGFEFSIPADK